MRIVCQGCGHIGRVVVGVLAGAQAFLRDAVVAFVAGDHEVRAGLVDLGQGGIVGDGVAHFGLAVVRPLRLEG